MADTAYQELATNIRRNLRHLARDMAGLAEAHRFIDYINHMDTLAQQIESATATPPADDNLCGACREMHDVLTPCEQPDGTIAVSERSAEQRAKEFWQQGGYDMGAVAAITAHINIADKLRNENARLRAALAEMERDATDGLVIHKPLPVFGDGPWIFSETGQTFTGDELNVEAFCRYRNALLAAPVPYGFGHLPQVATEDMQDNMRTALIDQGWTSDSAGEVDFQDIWDAAVVQFVESAEDAYAAILATKEGRSNG